MRKFDIKKLDKRQNRYTSTEQKVANAITTPVFLIVLILSYMIRILVKYMFKTKRHLARIAIFVCVFYTAYSAFHFVVQAPKPAHAMDGVKHTFNIPTLNPNVSQRQQNIDLINKIWGKDADTGLAIARCESGYRTTATHYNTNFTVDQGIFQYNSVHNLPEMDTAVANIEAAYQLYQNQGTNPWNSSKSCWNGGE